MTLHSIIVVIFGPYNVFPNREMEIFYLGWEFYKVTYLTYSTCIVRSESDMMERSGGVLFCEETAALTVNILEDIAKSC